MQNKMWLAFVIVAKCSCAEPEDVLLTPKEGDANWRISAGADVRLMFKSDFQMNAGRYNAAYPANFGAPANPYSSRDAVIAVIGNGTAADSQRHYDDGQVSTDSSGSSAATWNWAPAQASQYDAVNQTLAFSSYYGVVDAQTGAQNVDAQSEQNGMVGCSLDLARKVWQEGPFFIEVSMGGSYFPQRTLFSANQVFSAGFYRSGVYRVTDVYDVSGWGGFPPDPLSGGGYDGPGAVIPFIPTRTETLAQTLADLTLNGGAWAKTDVWLTEGRFCVIPQWQVAHGVSFSATIGAALEYVQARSRSGSWVTDGTTIQRSSATHTDDAVLVQAILGMGARFSLTEYVGLTVLGEARLPRTRIDVAADPYTGEIELGVWTVGMHVDYLF